MPIGNMNRKLFYYLHKCNTYTMSTKRGQDEKSRVEYREYSVKKIKEYLLLQSLINETGCHVFIVCHVLKTPKFSLVTQNNFYLFFTDQLPFISVKCRYVIVEFDFNLQTTLMVSHLVHSF